MSEAASEAATGWLIERQIGGCAVWWSSATASPCRNWTTDASVAIRFARKIDAEHAIRVLSNDWRHAVVTEHAWISHQNP